MERPRREREGGRWRGQEERGREGMERPGREREGEREMKSELEYLYSPMI